jgi:hypothetical protein
MGGPIPADRNLIMLRWLSTANYELVYHGHVYVLDAYFERGPRNRPTGVVPSASSAYRRSWATLWATGTRFSFPR